MRPKRCNLATSSATALGFLCVAFLSGSATAQVEVADGETLTEGALASGTFMGRGFTLAPGTVFNVNDDGVIGPVGDTSTFPDTPFDFGGSTVNVNSGGFFDGSSSVSNIVLNLFGDGGVGRNFSASNGSTVNFSGGSAEGSFGALTGSTVNISGGSFGVGFGASDGSEVNISGGEFMLNGAPVSSVDSVAFGDVLSGVLADGSAFIFNGFEGDSIASGTTTLQTTTVEPADATPMVVSSGDATTKGLRTGQTLTITGDARVRGGFDAIGGTLNIQAGSVGNGLTTLDTDVNISGGSVGEFYDAFGVVNISGGDVGLSFAAREGSTVTISGGTLARFSGARSGSTVNIQGGSVGEAFSASGSVNISGGTVGDGFGALSGSTVNISGGSIGDGFLADSGSTVNLFVTDVAIDAQALGLSLGETIEITQRGGVLLEATLADGSLFDLRLNEIAAFGEDFIDPRATLTVTRVPMPGTAGALGLAGFVAARRRRRR